jgi:hypothetical protein
MGQCLVIIIHQSNVSILVYISGRSCFSSITTYNIPTFLTLVLIKGGLICQQNVRTATLSQGGAYMPVNTVLEVLKRRAKSI